MRGNKSQQARRCNSEGKMHSKNCKLSKAKGMYANKRVARDEAGEIGKDATYET